MITTLDIKCNAAHPELALPTFYTYTGSWSTLKFIDVPKKVGLWEITGLTLHVTTPDGQLHASAAKRVNNIWIASVDPTQTAGKSTFGYVVYASGTDENGTAVAPWVLGKGDVVVIDNEGGVTPLPHVQYMTFVDEEPTPEQMELVTKGTAWPYEISIGDTVVEKGVTVWDGSNKRYLPERNSVVKNFGTQEIDHGQLTISMDPEGNYALELKKSVGNSIIFEPDQSETPTWKVHHIVNDQVGTFNLPNLSGEHTFAFDVALSDVTSAATQISIYVDEQISAIDGRLSDVEEQISAVDGRLSNVEADVTSISSQLSAKQDKLTDPQLAAIQEVEDKRATIFDKGESGESRIYASELGRNNIPAGVGTVEVGSTVGNIGNYAFSENYDLYWVDFSKAESLDTIGEFAFQNTYLNQNIVLPKKLTTIGQKAFSGGAYTSFTIPASVVNIGYLAFEDINCPIVFEGKSLAQVQSMTNYPWGHLDTTKITVTNVATEEWVEQQIGQIATVLEALTQRLNNI